MWEYCMVIVPDHEYEREIELLNNAGKDGWEFTGYTSDTGWAKEFLMKRKVND